MQGLMKNKYVFAGYIVSIVAVLMPIYGVYGKFFSDGMQRYMASRGLEDWTAVIGLGEFVSILLFLLPKTYKFGMLLMSALMGGAITLHMSNDEPFNMQVVVLLLVWVGGALRYKGKQVKI